MELLFNSLVVIFLSIVLEALPFVLIGVLASSLIHLFVSEDLIKRVLPKNRFLRILAAGLMGIFFPICECGIVLVVRRLIQKGVPLSTGIAFMLAVPIINPVVAASTHLAFPHFPMIYYRMGGAFLIAVLIGLILELFYSKDSKDYLRDTEAPQASCGCSHSPAIQLELNKKKPSKLSNIRKRGDELLSHATQDLFVMGRFLLIGSFIAAFIQTVVSRDILVTIGTGQGSSIAVMMGLAYALSICSEADAFVASSFSATFIPASLTAFLLYGPMTDIKNTLMMLACFKTRFVALWLALITVFVFLFAYIQATILGM